MSVPLLHPDARPREWGATGKEWREAAKAAVLSDCGTYRFALTRVWDLELPALCWVMLNPSAADDRVDDPTLRACIDFSVRWGFGKLVVVNLYAVRGADPSVCKTHPHPVGPGNDEAILAALTECQAVVLGWGNHGVGDRANDVVRFALSRHPRVWALKVTKAGAPQHPLYVARKTVPVVYQEAVYPFNAGGAAAVTDPTSILPRSMLADGGPPD
jgi:hypothetical protein